MVGACYIYGDRVEDAHTVPSFLQQKMNEAGYSVKVRNFGFLSQVVELSLYKIVMANIGRNDLIILAPPLGEEWVLDEFTDKLNLVNVLEKTVFPPHG